MPRLPIYNETQKLIGYGDILLHRDGDYAVVSVFATNGRQVEIMRERLGGNFSHCVSPIGTKDCLDKAASRG